MKTISPLTILAGASILVSVKALSASPTEQVDVIGNQLFRDTTIVSPTARITAEELQGINFVTSEDAIAYEPSLIIRRRYVGDSNGTMGIRGSNMFQTTRSLIFSDGLPLHYLLQTSFSGSPRWSLVSPDEIESAEVIYGPFSAEYSGNAMGGVVNIKTRDPQQRRIVVEGALFSQDYDNLSTSEKFNGGKIFTSFEDKFGDLGVYVSLSHLENDSHPQTQFAAASGGGGGTVVSGTIAGVEEHGNAVTYYGDSGPEHVTTDLFKLKLNYDTGDFQLRGIVAYEDRNRELDHLNNYLRNAAGNLVWDDNVTTANGINFRTSSFGTSNFQERHQDRESLLLGAGLSGILANTDWVFDIYLTNFQILKDEEVRSGRNPADPGYAAANAAFRGRITEYDDTGWKTLDVQTGTESLLGNDDLRLSLGYHFSNYELQINPYRYNSIAEIKGATRGSSGGETSIHALFAQWGWAFNPKWDLALGLRYEDWKGRNGFFDDNADGLIIGSENHPDRNESGFSPKFSLAHFVDDARTVRYSLARALRFPVTEELYQNVNEATQVSIANANLEPEDGIHHNLMLEQKIQNGFIRANLFYEEVEDAIFSQNVTVNGATLRTFLPVDEVHTKGIELVFNQSEVWDSLLDVRFNVSYIKSEITRNTLDTSLEGNDFPRMPRWRANLLLGYPLTNSVDINTGIRYASDSFGDLNNSDTENGVFGAQDDYLFVNARANWQATKNTQFSLGVDNIFDHEAYVHHQWPSRTFFLEGKVVLD